MCRVVWGAAQCAARKYEVAHRVVRRPDSSVASEIRARQAERKLGPGSLPDSFWRTLSSSRAAFRPLQACADEQLGQQSNPPTL